MNISLSSEQKHGFATNQRCNRSEQKTHIQADQSTGRRRSFDTRDEDSEWHIR